MKSSTFKSEKTQILKPSRLEPCKFKNSPT